MQETDSKETHQSTIDWQEIKLACSEEGIVANKLIQPAATRWNSNQMMMKSILTLRPGLRHVQENSLNPILTELIPTPDEFELIEAIELFFAKCKHNSEMWASNTQTTIDKIEHDVLCLHQYCANEAKKGYCLSSVLVPHLKNFQSELETRPPEEGIDYKYYNYGNFFNPSKRGVGVKLITKDTDNFLDITYFLGENYPTTLEFYAAHEAEMTVEKSETLDKAEVDELFDIIQKQELLETSQSKLKCPPTGN